jgi:glycosyltransferase involved in cell wall biosynthesis
VTVVTSRHDRNLPRHDVIGGVEVVRTDVVARVNKGTVSPTLPLTAARLARRARVAHMHLPMLEAGIVGVLARHPRLVTTYHCDVVLPPGAVASAAVRAVDLSARFALRRSALRIVTSDDYAVGSRLATDLVGASALPPPCLDRRGGSPRFRSGPGIHVGFMGRIVEEKGLEHLVDGFLALDDPDARLLIGGDYENVAGGSVVEGVRRHAGGDNRIRLLGFLPDDQIADFYASLDVFALPSINALEAFGIVQVEAMMAGVPAMASDLPGVRVPIRETGFGRIVPPRDSDAIATAIRELRDHGPDRDAGARITRARFSLEATLDAYERLLDQVAGETV